MRRSSNIADSKVSDRIDPDANGNPSHVWLNSFDKLALAAFLIDVALSVIAWVLGAGSEAFGIDKFAARWALLFVAAAIIFAFRPSSPLHKSVVDWKNRKHLAAILAIPIIVSLVLVPFSDLTKQGDWLASTGFDAEYGTVDGNEYNHLADALLEGHVTLDLPHSEILESMDNPYVWADRTSANAEAQEPMYWDYAWYNGEYYCYFGVLPCLLTYLPVKALTGIDLATNHVVLLFAILLVWALLLLLKQMQQKLFPKLSLAAFLVGTVVAIAACGVFEQALVPRVYEVPTTSGFMFLCLGLACWFKAKPGSEQLENDGVAAKVSKPLLVLGSLFVGCTLGCRPQFFVAVFLAFPIFWPEIRQRLFFSKKGLANTACAILPVLAAVLPIMWYNYIRFGSPTDFGAMYNLTGSDMTSFAWPGFMRSIGYVLEYLFLPFIPCSEYPFIQVVNNLDMWQVWTNEPYYAGFLFLNPALFISFALFDRKKRVQLREHGNSPMFLCLGCIVVALLLAAFDGIYSGVNMRYFVDFSLLLTIPALVCFWVSQEVRVETASKPAGKKKPVIPAVVHMAPARSRVVTVMACLALLGMAMYFLTFLATSHFGDLQYTSPEFYSFMEAMLFGC